MHSLSEKILQNYYYGGHHNDDGEINKKSTAIGKKKYKGEELGWKRKGKGRDKNHNKHIWFLSCGRQQSLIDYYSVELVNGGVGGGGGGGDRSSSVKASAMEDDHQRDGSLLSSSSYAPSSTTTAFATATTTATSTTMPSPDGSRGGGGKPKKGLKRFPRVLKAILFETSLAKKIRKRKNAQKGLKGGGNVYATTAGNVDPTKPGSGREPPIPNKNGAVELNSSTAPLAAVGSMSSTTVAGSNNSSTNSSSSVGSNLPLDAAAPGEIIQNDGKISSPTAAGKGRRYSSNVGLCSVLVSLVVLVLWGKICAIIFTSTWLFFVPRCIPGTAGSLSKIGAYCRKIEPEEYKKKVAGKEMS
ncbi:unnamed protein product [Linum trigynum]|uniref:Uncharacterized protein n=1 Tax=Linum trigynum TaxID=586398 RepID=A0AAV2C8C7_9ROSI